MSDIDDELDKLYCGDHCDWSKLVYGNQPTVVIDAGDFEDFAAIVFHPLAKLESEITGNRILFRSQHPEREIFCGATATF